MNRSARLLLSVLAAVTSTAALVDSGPAHAAPAPAAAETTSYRVRAGDSLVGIANAFGIRVSALLRANDLTLASVIYPGDVLTVPASSSSSARPVTTPTSVSTPARPSAPSTGTTPYVVVAGDALAGIAWANGVTLGALLRANDLTAASVIHPGRTLQIPPATRAVPTRTAASGTGAPANPSSNPASPPASPGTGSAPARPAATPVGATKVDTVIGYAKAQLGKPYRFFSAGPDAFDCSGLVVAAFRQAGVTLAHQSRAMASAGVAVDWTTEPIRAGDLVFTSSAAAPTVISHVGIALDDSTWIQAVGRGRNVSIGRLPVDTKILAVRRVL